MSMDERIRRQLDRLVEPVDDPMTIVDSIEKRSRPLQRPPVGRRLLLAAAACLLVLAAIGATQLFDGDGGIDHVTAGPDVNESETSVTTPGAAVSVRTERLGPIDVETSELRPAAESGFAEHILTFTNTSANTIYVDDLRTGAQLVSPQADTADGLVGTEGCGYGVGAEGVAINSCRRDYRPVGRLDPGDTATVNVTLWDDLPGLGRLGSGPYTFRFRVDYRDTPYTTMADSGTIGDVVVTYERLDALADPPTEASSSSTDGEVKAFCAALEGLDQTDGTTEASIALGAFAEVKRTAPAEVRDDVTVVSDTIIVNNYPTGVEPGMEAAPFDVLNPASERLAAYADEHCNAETE